MLKSTLTAITCLTCLLLAIPGCSRGQAAAQRSLEAALAQIAAAERGFTDESTDDYQAYRNLALNSALKNLQLVIASGSDDQVVVASRQLAQIDRSTARYETRLAVTADAALAAKSAAMLKLLSAVSEADARATLSSRDATRLLGELRGSLKRQSQRRAELTTKIANVETELAGVKSEQNRFREVAQSRIGQARKLEEQGFVSRGDARYDLLDQAAAAEREASQASAAADKQAAQAEMLEVSLQLDHIELEAVNNVIQDLDKRIAEITHLEQQRTTNLASAQTDRTAAQSELAGQFDEIAKTYAQEVDAPLDKAVGRADNAVRLLRTAQSISSNSRDRAAIQADQLSAMVDQAHVRFEHIVSVSSRAHVMQVLIDHGNRLTEEQLAAFQSAFNAINAKRKKLADELDQMVVDAKGLSESISDELTSALAGRVANYQQRVEALNNG